MLPLLDDPLLFPAAPEQAEKDALLPAARTTPPLRPTAPLQAQHAAASAKDFVDTSKQLGIASNAVAGHSAPPPKPTAAAVHTDAVSRAAGAAGPDSIMSKVLPHIGNAGLGSGARVGALAGAALGAIDPGKDDDGDSRGTVSGIAHGAMRGALVGGASGLAAKHLVVNPAIKPHLDPARAALSAPPTAVPTPAASGIPHEHGVAGMPAVTGHEAAPAAPAGPAVPLPGSPRPLTDEDQRQGANHGMFRGASLEETPVFNALSLGLTFPVLEETKVALGNMPAHVPVIAARPPVAVSAATPTVHDGLIGSQIPGLEHMGTYMGINAKGEHAGMHQFQSAGGEITHMHPMMASQKIAELRSQVKTAAGLAALDKLAAMFGPQHTGTEAEAVHPQEKVLDPTLSPGTNEKREGHAGAIIKQPEITVQGKSDDAIAGDPAKAIRKHGEHIKLPQLALKK